MPASPLARREKAKPARSFAIVAMVVGLIATVALPAYAATTRPVDQAEAVTLHQAAADNAQSLVVASEATPEALDRYSYSATTPEEIEKKKAEEAAAEAAAARAAATAAAATTARRTGSVASVDLSMTAAGSGEVRWPVASFNYQSYNLFGGYAGHKGFDMMTGTGTPIFAAASGVVRTSTDGGGSYGAVVMIDSVVGGQKVSTTYAHMSYGTRVVSAGQTVEAGQLIGQVGQTGYATAPHLHFEVQVNGSYIDPLAWLQSNAG
ncbi:MULTISPECIES: M23 family metallopeptidase [unclassified Microbacterium]|uniref:M23 family metallopeptidase n=1 Tax=unclassified Microbacterium TaxID=2609290 RepID=UPI00214B3159|nr:MULTISPECIES: M23 family metallopeptidase [unclassified Microbacterium]MCR2799505.1 M23 family metallopeptidase [Microbacterium sp. zg.Y818]MCR2824403.1 M23 family metallopeptidase [Microbacterium sp. zg.Y909]MCR2825686.1 M23 family metallopeptidase [Microbacterium sp. zg.Y909]WIM21500.1 M23 family metallopeptidase [Microbacterium sp. zg-Y818]